MYVHDNADDMCVSPSTLPFFRFPRRHHQSSSSSLLSNSNSEEEAAKAVAAVGLRVEKGIHESAGVDEPLPYLPTAEEDLENKIKAAEEESNSLEFLSKSVEERMLQEKFDVRVPYKVRVDRCRTKCRAASDDSRMLAVL